MDTPSFPKLAVGYAAAAILLLAMLAVLAPHRTWHGRPGDTMSFRGWTGR